MRPALTRILANGWTAADGLWLVHANAQALLLAHPGLTDVLTALEWQRLQRYRAPVAARAFAATRSVLRHMLGHVLETAPPTLDFVSNVFGKPALPGLSMPRFSISHAGDDVLIAIDREYALGVDIEQCGRRINWRTIAPMVMSPAELAVLEQHDSDDLFLQLWTQKEALAKALGRGLSAPLEKLATSAAQGPRWRRIALPPGSGAEMAWLIRLQELPQLHGHLASLGVPRRFTLQRLS